MNHCNGRRTPSVHQKWCWTLVPKLENKSIIGTRWEFRNKMDEQGKAVRNKSRLVAQGYNHQEGIDFTKKIALINGLKAIRIMLAFAARKNIQLFQIDVKSVFLNGFIEEEVYVKQPPGFEDHTLPDLNLKRLCMVWNKHLVLSMTDWVLFFYKMVL